MSISQMKSVGLWVAVAALLAACSQSGWGEREVREVDFVDYGVELDDATLERHGKVVQSMGKLVILSPLQVKSDSIRIHAPQLFERDEEGRRMCPDAWPCFQPQPTFGRCSAVLIGDDRVLTAAHCLREAEIGRAYFVFEHTVDRGWPIVDGKMRIPAHEVHAVECVVACSDSNALDWIVLKFERSPGRPPLRLDSGDVEPGRSTSVLLHPLGLPLKITRGLVQVSECDQEGFCYAPFDNGVGGSGGVLLDPEHGSVLGTVVGHEVWSRPSKTGNCLMPRQPSPGQKFVPVQQIRKVLESAPLPQCDRFPPEVQCESIE